MGKVDIEIIESDFNSKNNSTYDLSILIGMDRFTFLIADEQHRLLALRNYSWDNTDHKLTDWKEQLQQIYINDDLLKINYPSVKLAIESNRSTLIPQRLYRSEDSQSYLEKIFGELDHQEVLADEIPGIDALNIYQIDQSIDQLLQGYFNNLKLLHLCTPILTSFRGIAEQQPGKNIFVYVLDKRMYIGYFDDRELIFFNSYSYRTAKDFIYYLLLVFDQFQLKPESIPVHLSGYIVEESEIYHLLYRYIRLLHWIKPPPHFQFGPSFSATPKHLYFGLYSLRLCE